MRLLHRCYSPYPGLLSLGVQLSVVVVALARRSVLFLPGVDQFMQDRPQHLPEMPLVSQIAVIDGDLIPQSEPIVAPTEVTVSRARQPIDTQGDVADVE